MEGLGSRDSEALAWSRSASALAPWMSPLAPPGRMEAGLGEGPLPAWSGPQPALGRRGQARAGFPGPAAGRAGPARLCRAWRLRAHATVKHL